MLASRGFPRRRSKSVCVSACTQKLRTCNGCFPHSLAGVALAHAGLRRHARTNLTSAQFFLCVCCCTGGIQLVQNGDNGTQINVVQQHADTISNKCPQSLVPGMFWGALKHSNPRCASYKYSDEYRRGSRFGTKILNPPLHYC